MKNNKQSDLFEQMAGHMANNVEQEQMMQQLAALLPGSIPTGGDDQSISVEAEQPTGPDGQMEDETLLAILKRECETAKSFVRDDISSRATRAFEYYQALPEGDFAPPKDVGRSNFVDHSVQETVDWARPALVAIFASSAEVVEFHARRPEHEDAAEQTTALVNYVYNVQNNGYEITNTWIQDALLQPGAIVKVYWEENVATKTTLYRNQTDIQYAILSMDPSLTIVKHEVHTDPNAEREQMAMAMLNGAQAAPPAMQPPQPMAAPMTPQGPQGAPQAPQQGVPSAAIGASPMQPQPQQPLPPSMPQMPPQGQLHDIVVAENVKGGQVKVVNVPLEEFFVSPYSKHVDEGYSAHAVRRSIGQLTAMGFDPDLLEEIGAGEDDVQWTDTFQARHVTQTTYDNYDNEDYGDPSLREVEVIEHYIALDYDGTGIPQWRKVITSGSIILENTPVDGSPFVVMTSCPLSHLLFGNALAEYAMSYQLNQTAITRSMIDNAMFAADNQLLVDPENVNMEDLAESKPGGIVRGAIGSVVPLNAGSTDVGGLMSLSAMLEQSRQDTTGVMKLLQGQDADMINDTATGQALMVDQSQQRIQYMARHMGETGFKPMSRKIQQLVSTYQDAYKTMRLNGKWVDIDPASANNQYDLYCSVGLGTGDKTKTLGFLQNVLQQQMTAIQSGSGLSNPELVLNTLNAMVKAGGYAEPSQFFCPPPPPAPPGPPPQDPKILEIQAQAQSDQQENQSKMQLDTIRAQHAQDLANTKAANDHALAMEQMRFTQELAREKMYAELALQREIAMLSHGISVPQEQAAFSSVYNSTVQTVDQNALLQAIAQAPEPFGGPVNLGNNPPAQQ